ncbi:MAG: hypothetical protein ACRECT_03705 [Thermoplasmata archaeon]
MAVLSAPSSASARDGRRFLRELDRRLERLDRAILVADWDLFTGRSARGSAPWQMRRSALLSDERILRWARRALERGWPPLERRRLELLERVVLDTQVEQHPDVVRLRRELQRRIVTFRPRWQGRRVHRIHARRILESDPHAANRRRAYYASEPFPRSLEEPLRELIRLRNERARAGGYRTFAEMRLGFEGVTPSRLDALIESAVAPVPRPARRLRDLFATATGRAGWEPWDFLYAQERRVPLPDRSFPMRSMLPTILRAVAGWGFRTARMRFRVVFHDLAAGGLTLAPDPPRDIRILVHPRGGWSSYHVMFHEVGHAVHSAAIRAPRHLLRWHENGPGFGGLHEGIGALFEQIPLSAAWLSAQPGIGRERAEEFARARSDRDLLGAWTAAWIGIEQALYRDPDRDPMPEFQRIQRRLFGYGPSPPLSFVDSFYVESPVYAPNYLLATLFQYQIARTLRERFGEPRWPNSKVGPWLAREWFAPGSVYDWVPRIRAVTGRPFGASDFRAAFRDEGPPSRVEGA